MAVKLIKIAKELNVGTTTIVDFLKEKGFEVAPRPTSKITDEMLEELYKRYSNNRDVKEKADQLVIGMHSGKSDREKEVTPAKVKTPASPSIFKDKVETPVKAETPIVEEKELVEAKVETPVEKIEVKEKTDEEDSSSKPKLKVLGKIDLSPKKKKGKVEAPKKEVEKTPEPPKVEKPKEVEKVEKVEAPKKEVPKAKTDTAPEVKAPVESKMIRAKTPKLQGLKILGKIDSSKLVSSKSSKKKEEEKKAAAKSDAHRPKRKRTRKKVTAKDIARPRGKGKYTKPEAKEVSKKDIEDQIKATMARLGGGGKNKRQKNRRDKRDSIREKHEAEEAESFTGKLEVTEFISVSDLASLLNVNATEVIMTCMNLGVIVSINQRLDAELIEVIAEEHGREVEFISAEEQVTHEEEIVDNPEDLVDRAPIVTVMGHVDHGKTSLLDYIRSASVASGEAGGITQHIGAYEVKVGDDEKRVTFLDTPGHEAFTAMRARGAKVTDIAVIIIAADDRIMPQTKEAISHAQAANVPMVFAINKIDKAGADPERIKQELASMNLLVEAWGGKYQSQDISAKTGLNIDKLLEKILLEAELLELKANPNRAALGTIVEASLDKGRGYVTKILVQNGTLNIGDYILAGENSGKVKAMFNEQGVKVKTAGPSVPVLVLGLSGAPQAGESFKMMESEQEAKSLASKRSQITREQNNRASKRISLDEIGRRLALGSFKELNLIVKGDVDGSVEALADSLIKLSQETVQVNVIHKAVGQIIESDVLLASASDAIIVGFQVRPSMGARQLAEKEAVQIKMYSIIYEAIDEIKAAIEGLLEPTKEEKSVGQVEIKETYKISRIGTIAGCQVIEGKLFRNSLIRIIREGIVIFPIKEGAVGEVSSLKRFKDDVKEVRNGMECGITIKNYNDIKPGDIIEAYEIVEVKQKMK